MDVVKTLRPGKNGTKRYVELYGDNLVAVRYRLDAEKQLSYTTVELIIERRAAPLKGLNRRRLPNASKPEPGIAAASCVTKPNCSVW